MTSLGRWREAGGAIALALACLSGAGIAHAELYRCVQPDGSVVYTDSEARCPGARPHEPAADVQNVVAGSAPAARAPRAPGRSAATDAAAEEMAATQWREKKLQAQSEFEQVAYQHGRLERYVKVCNRGGDLYRERENGLRDRVSCASLHEEVARLGRRRDDLRAYLDQGLPDECRRAGCLPGWIR